MDRSRYVTMLPNAITLGRLLSVPVLAWFAYREMYFAFTALLIPSLASDVLDGWLARRLGVVSALGTALDSIADILLMAVILYAIWPLHPEVYRDHGWVIISVVALLLVGHIGSLIRYGRLASFHTQLIRAGIFAFSLFAMVLFLFGYYPWLLFLAAFICALGALEHFAMLALLPEWTPNVHGGLPVAWRRWRESRS